MSLLEYINVLFFDKLKSNEKQNAYIDAIQIVEETKDRLNKNANLDMTIDNLLLKIWETINCKY